jgi:hypothetical protein
MKRKKILIIAFVMMWAVVPFVIAEKPNFGFSDTNLNLPQPSQRLSNSVSHTMGVNTNPIPDSMRNESIPDHITYDQLFRLVRLLDEQAAKLQAEGLDGKIWSEYFQRESGLTLQEVSVLRQTAAEFQIEIEPIDRRANEILVKRRAAYPGGQIPEGTQLPPPPTELIQLQEQRNQIALNKRDQLNNLLGTGAGSSGERFALFVQQNIANNMRVIETADPTRRARANQAISKLP